MISVDTNLLVRLATRDDAPAFEAVAGLMQEQDLFIPKTVLLECEWVLRSRFGYSPAEFLEFAKYLASLPRITLEDEGAVLTALEIAGQRIDFADALHLASGGDLKFVTMDVVLARRAARIGANVQLLLRRR